MLRDEISMHSLLMYMAQMVCQYSAFFRHAGDSETCFLSK